jgi:hypothetical protein
MDDVNCLPKSFGKIQWITQCHCASNNQRNRVKLNEMFLLAPGWSPEIENSLRYAVFSFDGGSVVDMGAVM